ncbi:hypothetical protein EBQ90_06870 [bacterium]|nr:hypothetical protein [bacterium]
MLKHGGGREVLKITQSERRNGKMKESTKGKPDFLLEACGHFLSDWNDDKYKTAEEIIDGMLAEGDSGIFPEEFEPWQPFETYPADELTDMIRHMAVTYSEMFDAGVRHGLSREVVK